MDEYSIRRRQLVDELRAEGITDQAVLDAMGRVPREMFVPPEYRRYAYENRALPIGQGQTISQPYVVAAMTEALALGGSERVLEIGTGSGYQAAILAELSNRVVSLELLPELSRRAEAVLTELGYANIELHVANGSVGWSRGAPYDRIIVTAAGPEIPADLLDQLDSNGRLVMPVGGPEGQELVLVTRANGDMAKTMLGPVRFVPLLGKAGWQPLLD